MPFTLKESDEIPVCHYCGMKLEEIFYKSIGIMTGHTVYFCPHCKKILQIVAGNQG